MQYFDEVVQVRLDSPRATDATLICLKRLPHVGHVSLRGSKITDAGLAHLKEVKSLGGLSLAETQISDAGLVHLQGLPGLTWLVLDDTSLTDAGLQHLESMPGLRELSLARTRVTDAGMVRLQKLVQLSGLTLDGTSVTNAGLERLKPLGALQMLKLDDTEVTDDAFTEFAHTRRISGGPRGYQERRAQFPRAPGHVFDTIVWGSRGSQAAKRRLLRLLERKVRSIDRICTLTDTQRQELEQAGRGDIEALFQAIDEERARLTPEGDNASPDFDRLVRDAVSIWPRLRKGTFGDGPLLSKTLQAVLTPEQTARLQGRADLARESKRRIGVENAGELEKISEIPIDARKIAWDRKGTRLAFLTFAGETKVFDGRGEQRIGTLCEGRRLGGFDFSPDPAIVAISDQTTGKASVLHLDSGDEIQLRSPNQQASVKFSPDGKMVATGGYGTFAHLWSASTGKLLHRLDMGPEGGLTPEFSPDGSILAVGNRNSLTQLFEAATGKWRGTLERRFGSHELRFDPSGKTLAVVYVDGSIVLWDVQTSSPKRSAAADADELFLIDWSPDGSVLATAGRNSLVTLWNATDLSILNELESPDWVFQVGFSPDGTRLFLSGGMSGDETSHHVELWAAP